MAYNKIIYSGTTLIDTTSDTATASQIASGYTAHSKEGTQLTGTLEFITYYTGSGTPSSSLGSNGDIYLKVAN